MIQALALQGKHIVLGLSGGVACYKAAELVRLLVKAGAQLQVVMTDAATQFKLLLARVYQDAADGHQSTLKTPSMP